MGISVVINTYNEASLIEDCLKSVKDFVSEIVVVDMGSTDETLKIAKKYNAKVFEHPFLDYVEPARNFAISKASNEWVLILDPDERVPKALGERLSQIALNNEAELVRIPRKNILLGKWMKHTNWWPDYHVRFFKKGKLAWSKTIHATVDTKGTMQVDGEILSLEPKEELSIEHLNYDSINQFLERQNRYSTVSARNRYQNGERFSLINFVWKPKRVFLQRFFRHAGFKDGFHGFALSLLASYSQMAEEVKLWEMEHAK